MTNIVGTAYVIVRAVTEGVRRDIERGVKRGAERADPQIKRQGEKSGRTFGEAFGESIGDGIEHTNWGRIVSRSVGRRLREIHKENEQALKASLAERAKIVDRAHADALRQENEFEKNLQRNLAERVRRINDAHAEAVRIDKERTAEARRQGAERRRIAIEEIKQTIRVAKAYEDEAARVNNAVSRNLRNQRRLVAQTANQVRQSLTQLRTALRRQLSQISAIERESLEVGRVLGRRIGRGIGQELALEIRRIPIMPFVIAAFAPAIAGIAKVLAAFVGELVALLSPIGPAISASLAVLTGSVAAVAQGFGVFLAAIKTEGPTLDRFNDRLENTKDEFRAVGREIQEVTLDSFNESIERATAALLPRFRSELRLTGRIVADVGEQFAGLSEDPFFQARFGTVLASNNRVLQSLGRAAVFLADSLVTVLSAASPLTEQFADYIRRVSQGWSETLRLSQETGRLADWFRRTGEFLQQLGRIGSNVRQALGETFRIASGDAENLWRRIEILTERWRDFTRSVSGRNQIAEYFTQARAVVMEVNGLFGDMFRMIGRGLISNSESVIDFVRTLRFRVLPAIADMSSSFAGLAPVFNDLVIALANFFRLLAESGVIRTFLTTMENAFSVIEGLLSLPVAGTVLGWTLAFLAMGRALNIVTLGAFTRLLRPLAGRLGTVAGALLTVGRNAVVAAGGGGIGALRGSLGGLMAALGGPWGIAIAAAVTGIGFLVKSHLDAKRAAEEHEAKMLDFVSTLDDATGAITAQSREWVANEALTRGMGDTMAGLRLEMTTLTDAALGNANAQERLNSAVDLVNNQVSKSINFSEAQAAALEQAGSSAIDFGQGMQNAQGPVENITLSQEAFREALEAGGSELDEFLAALVQVGAITPEAADEIRNDAEAHRELIEFTTLLNERMAEEQARLEAVATAAGTTSAEVRNLSEAIEVLGDEFASADEKARALDEAIRILEGGTRDVDQANRRLHQTFRDVEDAFVDNAASAEAGKNVYLDLSSAINESTGELDQSTEVGARVGETFDRMQRVARESAIAIAENGGSAADVREPFDAMNAQFRDLLETAGATPGEIDKIMSSLETMPTEAIVDLILNSGEFDDSVDEAETRLQTLDSTRAIASLLGDDQDLAYKITQNVTDLDALDKIIAEATADLDDSEAKRVYDQVMALLFDLESQRPTPTADLDPRVLEAEKARIDRELDRLDRERPTPEVLAEIGVFQQRRNQVNSMLNSLDRSSASPTISASDRASATIRNIQRQIDNMRGRTLPIHIVGRRGSSVGSIATGAVVRPGDDFTRLRTASSGLLARREPMVAKGGSNILWAEPETHAESYIPWNPAKRTRAMTILRNTARAFGHRVTPMQEGGVITRNFGLTESTFVEPRPTTDPVTVPTFNILVDGPEVAFRAKKIAEETITEYRRLESIRSRIPRG